LKRREAVLLNRVYYVEIGGGVEMACAERQDCIVEEAVLPFR
jgi:hypothetical protein